MRRMKRKVLLAAIVIQAPVDFFSVNLKCRVTYTGCIKKSRQFRNGSQPREAASSMKFFLNRDCLGTCDVE